MAELIRREDDLNTGREKLNNAIVNADEAKKRSNQAVDISEQAKQIAQTAENKADSVQEQFNQVVIEGDSSVEAAQARVDEKGQTHATLKDRIDDGFTKVNTQLAHKVNRDELEEIITTPIFYNSIQEALNYLSSVGGGTLTFPKGTFIENFSIPSNVSIVGTKATVLKNCTITINSGLENISINTFRTENTYIHANGEISKPIKHLSIKNIFGEDNTTTDLLIKLQDIDFLELENIHLYRSNGGRAIYLVRPHNLTIRNVFINGRLKTGINLLNETKERYHKNLLFENVHVERDLTYEGDSDHGIYVHGFEGLTMLNVSAKGWANPPNWQPNTNYKQGDMVSANGNRYLCVVGGTSGTTAPNHTSGQHGDGSVIWEYLRKSSENQYDFKIRDGKNATFEQCEAEVFFLTSYDNTDVFSASENIVFKECRGTISVYQEGGTVKNCKSIDLDGRVSMYSVPNHTAFIVSGYCHSVITNQTIYLKDAIIEQDVNTANIQGGVVMYNSYVQGNVYIYNRSNNVIHNSHVKGNVHIDGTTATSSQNNSIIGSKVDGELYVNGYNRQYTTELVGSSVGKLTGGSTHVENVGSKVGS